jgi:integrase
MASIRTRKGSKFLLVDFMFMGQRCRETTNLLDNPANRKKLEKVIQKMEAEITLGIFDYKSYFPKSNKADELMALKERADTIFSDTPLFGDFAKLWFDEKKLEWRPSYQIKVRIILEKYLMKHFGHRALTAINRADVLAFRASLAKVNHGKANNTLSATRINSIMMTLHMILEEASKRYKFENPSEDIKNLKLSKREIMPFSLSEVWLFINNVREDYKNYYTVRFFTGMRTSEIDGLLWQDIDFNRKEIHVRRALVEGELGEPKTLESTRDIAMSPWVYEALQAQYKVTCGRSKFVFCDNRGNPFDYRNINRRIWTPTLKNLGLKHRRAYETRHTAATLWLAAGEAPEWIAKQMGHANTMMLFKVYSRYVPNNTRQDGSAFEALIASSQPANQNIHQNKQ